jgi:hypothetical protein
MIFYQSSFTVSDTWIGLNDIDADAVFEWTSGETVGFTNYCNYPANNGCVNPVETPETGFCVQTSVMWYFGHPERLNTYLCER